MDASRKILPWRAPPCHPDGLYSAINPSFYQISRQEQVLDIMRNVTTTPADHVKTLTFKGGGGKWAALFDGTEKVVSWDNIVWLNRTVLLP